ncbi:Lrp/AsnC family transcriptional regulator [Paracoccus suum]|uniref:Lrp/AsnC family transcriptional regulator n=1 Tax=Paracoccus suum TaxID=2259340 RepID=A0A344PN90_9RHOB|nr:Lrp/AsnC family transcriptional regulator [Paracoccus suum]
MSVRLDDLDRKILRELQEDAGRSLDEIAKLVGSSKTPVWNRIRKLRAAGVIAQPTILVSPEALGLEACFFVLIRTAAHEADWQAQFLDALRSRPEVLEAHRLAGEVDYILKVRVENARAYDRFYQSLIAQVKINSVSALLSMEEVKATTVLPVGPIKSEVRAREARARSGGDQAPTAATRSAASPEP